MQVKSAPGLEEKKNTELPGLICRAVALAMGVAVAVLSFLKQVDSQSAIGMLAVGLTALAVSSFLKKDYMSTGRRPKDTQNLQSCIYKT